MKKEKQNRIGGTTAKGIPLIDENDIADITQINDSLQKIDELVGNNEELELHKNKSFISPEGVHNFKYDPITKNFYQKVNNIWEKIELVVKPTPPPPPPPETPILNFRGKGIRNLEDFNSDNVAVNWSGTNMIVTDGIKTNQGSWGEFNFDFTNFEEITISYTFQLHNRGTWSALLNLAYTTTLDTSGFKFEHADDQTISLEGIFRDRSSVIATNQQNSPRTNIIELNKKYNFIIVASLTNPVKIFSNGILIHTINQPQDQKGWNGFNHVNINKNAFCNRLSSNKRDLTVTHHALRIWDKALSEEQIINEFNNDNNDYQIL